MMVILMYNVLEKDWKTHSQKMSIRPTAFGMNLIQLYAEFNLSMENVLIEYLILAAQLIVLKEKFNKEEFHVSELIDIVDRKLTRTESEQQYDRPTRKGSPAFTEYADLVKGVRYDALNSYLHHIMYAILSRERQVKSSGSSNAAKSIKIGMFIDGMLKSTDKVIKNINDFVDVHFPGKDDLKKEGKDRELQKMREWIENEGAESHGSSFEAYHGLKRNVEETALLKKIVCRTHKSTIIYRIDEAVNYLKHVVHAAHYYIIDDADNRICFELVVRHDGTNTAGLIEQVLRQTPVDHDQDNDRELTEFRDEEPSVEYIDITAG
ncbi:hypothetical protein MBANPS3_012336 [Mucor bainieri]